MLRKMKDRCRHTVDLLDGQTDRDADRKPKRYPTLVEIADWHERLKRVEGECTVRGNTITVTARRGAIGRTFTAGSFEYSAGEVERVVARLEQWATSEEMA